MKFLNLKKFRVCVNVGRIFFEIGFFVVYVDIVKLDDGKKKMMEGKNWAR
jgi:hypothetical protein